MKRFGKCLLLFCVMAVLMSSTASADSGPKPQLIVRLINGPDEPYFLDVLTEGNYQGEAYDGIQWSYSDEEAAELDSDLLEMLRNAVPDGWHACTAEGTLGAPMWGDLVGENGLHTFRYVGVPYEYRVLVVTKSGEVWMSDVCYRDALQSSVTVDWETKNVKVPPTWVGYLLQFLATLLPTLLIEGILLLAFGFVWRINWKPFLLVNLVTQGGLAVFMSFNVIQHGVGWWFLLSVVQIEIVIAIVEACLFRKLLKGHSKVRAFGYGLAANAASAVIGWFLAVPVWRWIVSIS